MKTRITQSYVTVPAVLPVRNESMPETRAFWRRAVQSAAVVEPWWSESKGVAPDSVSAARHAAGA